jgi:hypothetical protein
MILGRSGSSRLKLLRDVYDPRRDYGAPRAPIFKAPSEMCSNRLFVPEPSPTKVALLHSELQVFTNIKMPRIENASIFIF